MAGRAVSSRVVSFDRQVFIDTIWTYDTGEHVSFIGPTGSGKTTLAYQLLIKTATPALPAIVLVMKPRDTTVLKFSKRANFRTVRTWPPTPSPWRPRKPPGWVLWPTHSFDAERDDHDHYFIFRRCLRDSYKVGDRIVFGDEVYSLSNELAVAGEPPLTRDLIRMWSKGRSMGCGLWAATQKPTHVPLWMYSQPEHLFLAHDPDQRAQDRFAEIGGVDPRLVAQVVASLPRYHWLYIRRSDRTMCVVGP